MTLNELQTLFLYNDWANDRLVIILYDVFGDETDLFAHADAAIRALQATVVHIIEAQAIWRTRCEDKPTAALEESEYPTPLALRFAFGAERARFWNFFETLETDDALNRVVHYRNSKGDAYATPLWQILQHGLTHGIYHRGQVTARLIDGGHADAIISTDLITFYRDRDPSQPDGQN